MASIVLAYKNRVGQALLGERAAGPTGPSLLLPVCAEMTLNFP
jgi:hypothetical protein